MILPLLALLLRLLVIRCLPLELRSGFPSVEMWIHRLLCLLEALGLPSPSPINPSGGVGWLLTMLEDLRRALLVIPPAIGLGGTQMLLREVLKED